MFDLKRKLLRIFFRCIKVRCKTKLDIKNLPEKALFISNHVSFLDPVLIYAFLPGNPVLALNSYLLRKRWIRFLLRGADIIEFNPIDPTSLKEVITKINGGRRCFLFPEGRLTKNGGLMKIYEAPGIIADKTDAPIIPVWINGAEYSYFSILKGKLHLRPLPRTTITIDKPINFKLDNNLRRQRDYLSNQIYRIMIETKFKTLYDGRKSLFNMLMKTAKINAKEGFFVRKKYLEDIKRKPQSFKDIIIKSFILGNYFKEHFKQQEHIGLLLPNSCANICAFFGLVAYERVPTMINFSSGIASVVLMCKTALVENIITSREFIETAKLQEMVSAIESSNIKIYYLEDIAKTFTLKDKLYAYLLYKKKYIPFKNSADKECAVLFTSGSEGAPKAVVLSHNNMVSNVLQCKCFFDLNNSDILFNILPMFHCFGLTIGSIFPLLCGSKLFLYPSPLHYRIIPELVYETGATALLATDTFFRGYSKVAHSYDFNSIRLILGGAEAIKQDTRETWSEIFGVRLLEGYGATECAPVIAANNPVFCRFGSVGQMLPGVEYKFEKVDGIKNGGVLYVKGPNIMKGYIKAGNPGKIVPLKDGWYNTGDVVEVDNAGYFFIKDRIKRFAKIGGEMVSLTHVENIAEKCFKWMNTEFQYCAISIPHESKGEQIVLVTDNKMVDMEKLQSYIKNNFISELCLPKTIIYKEEIPVLPSGKRDNIKLKQEILVELGMC
ncbi:MAG: AMP-binding protein [Rickettsiales bacterium]|nr:AMP-binding protein [Rickettsiales bacterium]